MEANIAELMSESGVSDTKIGDLLGAIAEAEKGLKDATTIREKGSAGFAASEKELIEAIDTFARAEGVLSQGRPSAQRHSS